MRDSGALGLLPVAGAGSAGWFRALLVSALLHAGLATAILLHWQTLVRGGGGVVVGALEIEVVSRSAAASASPTAPLAAGAAGATAEVAGETRSDAATAAGQSAPAARSPGGGPPPVEDAPADAMAAGRAGPIQRLPEPSIAQPVQTTSGEPAPTGATASVGGTVAPSVASQPAPAPVRIVASPGDVARFQSALRRALVRGAPIQKRRGPPIAAVVAFRVTATGHAETIELLEPSTDDRMNAQLLAWIAGTVMPVPPQGMDNERWYCLPLGSTAALLRRHERCR